MTTTPQTVPSGASVAAAAKTMRAHQIRHLPVVDGTGGVLGMVSIGDLVKAVIQDQAALIEQLESYIAH